LLEQLAEEPHVGQADRAVYGLNCHANPALGLTLEQVRRWIRVAIAGDCDDGELGVTRSTIKTDHQGGSSDNSAAIG